MAGKRKPIRYGSIIHLQNGDWDENNEWVGSGGYLETRGRVNHKKTFINDNIDSRIRGWVFTHSLPNRLMGSGSWEILSREEKPIGTPVKMGDKVYLRNIFSDNEYLSSFEWAGLIKKIKDLDPFKANSRAAMGVFATSTRNRGGGESGTWVIESTGSESEKEGRLFEGDKIRLLNGFKFVNENKELIYRPVGYLHTYGDVANVFKKYNNQQKLVFVDHSIDFYGTKLKSTLSKYGSDKWCVTLSGSAENSYYLWGKSKTNEEWLDYGIIKYSGLLQQTLVEVHIIFSTKEDFVIYGDDEKIPLTVKKKKGHPNRFKATHQHGFAERFIDGEWTVGAQTEEINKIHLFSNDGGQTFEGVIDYEGLGEIQIKGVYATKNLFSTKQELILNEFFEPALWESRIDKVKQALDIVEREFKEVASELKRKNTTKEKLLRAGSSRKHQMLQLSNLITLWHNMQQFWKLFTVEAKAELDADRQTHRLPPVHQIRACLRQFTVDFEILQRAILQRQTVVEGDETTDINSFGNSLTITDKLALMTLAPMRSLISDSTEFAPITYFSKSIHIRQLPYTDNFILVGLSYDLAPQNDGEFAALELMAIPHEVGHFMYHNAKLDVSKLPHTLIDHTDDAHINVDHSGSDHEHAPDKKKIQTFADLSRAFEGQPYYEWCEEIFSDIYGCLIGGPLTVLGMQAHLASGDRKRVLKDDKDHPTPILRPYILSEILRTLSKKKEDRYNFSDTAIGLDANWSSILERWGFALEGLRRGRPTRIFLPDDDTGHFDDLINVRKVLKNAQPIIDIYADLLIRNVDFEPWEVTDDNNKFSAEIPWTSKHHSLEEYIQDVKELVHKRLEGKESPIFGRVDERELDSGVKKNIKALLAGSNDDLLKGWGDNGPTGGGGGTYY